VQIIPAIDLRGGRVVRLEQGDYARESQFAVDPVELARGHAVSGARWLHVVDLDGARDGHLANLRTIAALAKADDSLRVQAGGGVRGEDDLRRLIDAGVTRVVVGSLAVRAPETVQDWMARHGPERIVVALDARFDGSAWRLPVAGWREATAATLDELAPRFARAGLVHLLCTDIDRDGMLNGPNLESIAPGLAVQASGGVRDERDLRALRGAGVAGAILGRSLLEGRLTVAQALAC
jgi:phosphoribosylformimino-5-aminoimidazole carboxamide ribotide isomerase